MNLIYDAAAKFLVLTQSEYRFVVSQNRKLKTINLNFVDTDFFHVAGLHYLTDIVIPKDRTRTLDEILIRHSISDQIISRSVHYASNDSKKDIRGRIEELRFLEEYLDTDNFMKIFNVRNQKGMYSTIEADYLIESWFKNSSDTVYIFIRQRKENPEYYCVVSFFKKDDISYGGDKVYWMEKVKKHAGMEEILYIHPGFKKL